MDIRLLTLLIAATLASPALASDESRLNDQAIRTLVVGKTLLGQYPDGEPWRETYFVDDGIDYQDTDYRLSGSWYAENDALCTFYDQPGNFEGGCFMVVMRSPNCIDFYAVKPDTNQPQATASDIVLGIGWTARAWRSDQRSTCPEDLSS